MFIISVMLHLFWLFIFVLACQLYIFKFTWTTPMCKPRYECVVLKLLWIAMSVYEGFYCDSSALTAVLPIKCPGQTSSTHSIFLLS